MGSNAGKSNSTNRKSQMDSIIVHQVRDQIRNHVYTKVRDKFLNQIQDRVGDKISQELFDYMNEEIERESRLQTYRQVFRNVEVNISI